jgi:hypothetical protein
MLVNYWVSLAEFGLSINNLSIGCWFKIKEKIASQLDIEFLITCLNDWNSI